MIITDITYKYIYIMKKIRLYLGLAEAIYGTPRVLKFVRFAFRLFLLLSLIIFSVASAYITYYGYFFFAVLLFCFFNKYWFRWEKKCSKLSTKIRKLEFNDDDWHEELISDILIDNMFYYNNGYQGGLNFAEERYTLKQLHDIRWELIDNKTHLRGTDKYMLLNDVEEIISRRELKEKAAV